MTLQRILVTGSSGCLGFPLANRLAQEGRTVIGLDIERASAQARFAEVAGDVGDAQLLRRLFTIHRFDAVVHCGGISGQMVAADDPYRICQVNVFGTVNLLEAARTHNVARFIYASSQGAYGESAIVAMTEATPFLPATVYGATKAACDSLVRGYSAQHGINATSLRIGRVYGPGRRTGSVITSMVKAALTGEPLVLPGTGGRKLQYVYDADIVSALYHALHAERLPSLAYNVSGPDSYSDEEIAAMLVALAPRTDIVFEDSSSATGTFPGAPMDCSAAKRDFFYTPEYDMARGLKTFLQSLQGV
jgi:UDP-glucuronate 4-epimerase